MPTTALEAKSNPTSTDIRARIRDLKGKRDKLKQDLKGAPRGANDPEDEPRIKKYLGRWYRPEQAPPSPDPKVSQKAIGAELESVEESIHRLRDTLHQVKHEEIEGMIAARTPEYHTLLGQLLKAVTRAVELNEQLFNLEYDMHHRYGYSLTEYQMHGLKLTEGSTLKDWKKRVELFLGQAS